MSGNLGQGVCSVWFLLCELLWYEDIFNGVNSPSVSFMVKITWDEIIEEQAFYYYCFIILDGEPNLAYKLDSLCIYDFVILTNHPALLPPICPNLHQQWCEPITWLLCVSGQDIWVQVRKYWIKTNEAYLLQGMDA